MSDTPSSPLPGMALIQAWTKRGPEDVHPHKALRKEVIQRFILIFGLFNFAFLVISPAQTLRNYELLFFLGPLWMPLMLYQFAFVRRLQSKQAEFLAKQKHVLLELRLPRDTMKPLLAMETFFTNMNFGPGESNWYKRLVNGAVRPWWSFEIVSLGGQVHFYIWTREAQRRGIEALLYAQFPDMEIIEAEDYSRLIDPSDEEHSIFGDEWAKKVEDAWPLRTYTSYGLEKAGAKPEEQVDPLSQVIELLGSIGPKEQLWIQFVIRQTKWEKFAGRVDEKGKQYTWATQAKELIEGIRKATVRKTTFINPVTGAKEEMEGFPNPTKGQVEAMAGLETNVAKAPFDVGTRIIYTAPKDAFVGSMANFIVPIFKPFSWEGGQALNMVGHYSGGFQDYPWEDPTGEIHHHVFHELVQFYRRRAFFVDPYIGHYSIMSSEELATLFHIPSATVATPSLPRIQSSTTGAPANLPT